jgi:hypothetical protein
MVPITDHLAVNVNWNNKVVHKKAPAFIGWGFLLFEYNLKVHIVFGAFARIVPRYVNSLNDGKHYFPLGFKVIRAVLDSRANVSRLKFIYGRRVFSFSKLCLQFSFFVFQRLKLFCRIALAKQRLREPAHYHFTLCAQFIKTRSNVFPFLC